MSSALPRLSHRKSRLAFGVLGSPLAWVAHLVVSYALVPVACLLNFTLLLHFVTVITAVVAAAAGFVAWRFLRAVREADPDESQIGTVDRFLGQLGVFSGVFFAVVIIVEGLPNFVISPCNF